MDIINFVQITDAIASSGQPLQADFSQMVDLGYETVVNLALVTSDNAIVTEGDVVTELGMCYVHIPVLWKKPTLQQFQLFVAVMQQQRQHKVWVHCALNMRASAFLYLYSRLYLTIAERSAVEKLSQIWQPNKIWSQFIVDIKNTYHRLS